MDEPVARPKMRRTLQPEKKSVEVTHDQDVGLAATDVHADEDQEIGHVSAVDDADGQVALEVTRQEVVGEVDSGRESCCRTELMSVEGEDAEVAIGIQQHSRTVNRPPPKPVPRRSGRPRREPERFQDYVAHGVQLRPSNAKLEAVKALVISDVLHSMDCDVAKHLLESLLK